MSTLPAESSNYQTFGQINLQDADEIGEAEVQAKKPKRQIKRVQLNESTLLQPTKGLKRLYQITKTLKLTDNPKKDLRNLLDLYKEWHFVVAAKFEFNYFIQKCQVLGTKAPVRSYMNRLRDFHSGKIGEDEFENPISQAPDDDMAHEQVYETPEKLLNSFKKNDEKLGNDLNEKMPSPKVLNYFDELEENQEELDEEMQFLKDLENGNVNHHNDMVELEEMDYLQELALQGTGKRLIDVDQSLGVEQQKYLKDH